MERREFIAALSALAVSGHILEAAAKDETLTLDDHIRQLKEWANELEQKGEFQGQPFKLTEEEFVELQGMVSKNIAVDKLTREEITQLMLAAEDGDNAGYCPSPPAPADVLLRQSDPAGAMKRILVEGKVAVDRHGFVVTDAIMNPIDRWKLAPIYDAMGPGGRLETRDGCDWLWGMRITYLEHATTGLMVMWTSLEVEYEPLRIKNPNAVVNVYL